MRVLKLLGAVVVVASLVACGGGGGGVQQDSLSLIGTAATGNAIANAPITAKCVDGVASTTTNADGTYNLTSTIATLPCVLRVTIEATGTYLHSVAESSSTVVNISPVTELITSNVLGVKPSTVFNNLTNSDLEKITSTQVTSGKEIAIAVVGQLGVDFTTFDPIKDHFIATSSAIGQDGDSNDKKLDVLAANISASGLDIDQISLEVSRISASTGSNSIATIASVDDLQAMYTYSSKSMYETTAEYNARINNESLKLASINPITLSIDVDGIKYDADTETAQLLINAYPYSGNIYDNSVAYSGMSIRVDSSHSSSYGIPTWITGGYSWSSFTTKRIVATNIATLDDMNGFCIHDNNGYTGEDVCDMIEISIDRQTAQNAVFRIYLELRPSFIDYDYSTSYFSGTSHRYYSYPVELKSVKLVDVSTNSVLRYETF